MTDISMLPDAAIGHSGASIMAFVRLRAGMATGRSMSLRPAPSQSQPVQITASPGARLLSMSRQTRQLPSSPRL